MRKYYLPRTNKKLLLWLKKIRMKCNFYSLTLTIIIIFSITNSCLTSFKSQLKEVKYSPKIKPYVEFIEKQKTSSKDYIISLFNNYDIVILCERDHRDITQYEFILDLIKDKKFIDSVGNIFIEVGSSSLNPRLNEFLKTQDLDSVEVNKKVRFFHRNAGWYPLWEKYNLSYFIKNIYYINNQLSQGQKLTLYPSDIPFLWDSIRTVEDYDNCTKSLDYRDSIMANYIITQFDEIHSEKRKKALIIMNYRHAFGNYPDGSKPDNVGRYLFERYKGQVANVYLNSLVVTDDNEYTLIQKGKWDAAFKVLNNPNIGFNFKDSPFGNDNFDIAPALEKQNFKYKDIFTGFIFYLPLEKHLCVVGIPEIISTDGFEQELKRRINILYTPKTHEDSVKLNNIDLKVYEIKQEFPYKQIKNYKKEINKWL